MFDKVLNTPLYNNDMSFENCQVFWFRLIWPRLIHQLLRLSQTFFSFLISVVERYHGLTWFINYTNISCLKYRNFLMQEFWRTHSFRRVSDDSPNTPKLPKLCVSSKLTRKSGEITLFFGVTAYLSLYQNLTMKNLTQQSIKTATIFHRVQCNLANPAVIDNWENALIMSYLRYTVWFY